MENTDSRRAYEAPMTTTLEVNVRRVLCQSDPSGKNTEKFTLGNYSYGDDDFE